MAERILQLFYVRKTETGRYLQIVPYDGSWRFLAPGVRYATRITQELALIQLEALEIQVSEVTFEECGTVTVLDT